MSSGLPRRRWAARIVFVPPLCLSVCFAALGAVSLHQSEAGACAHVCGPIQHVVYIVKQNRTYDTMFGRFPHANGATTYRGEDGVMRPLGHEPERLKRDLAHDWKVAGEAFDNKLMDQF